MKTAKQNKLKKAGWTIGSASDLLELSAEEDALITMKLSLASNVKKLRKAQNLTQQELAEKIESSQSRVAKMEVADKSVSMELFIRTLVSLGASRQQIGKVIGSQSTDNKKAALNKSDDLLVSS
ncbi:MAG: helix-turn-helix transcriptional regulator [Verrucomicrobiales bacterium]|nr:helix-turn-helix transcriptional regulator [Verrucomicrobiales bacterium]